METIQGSCGSMDKTSELEELKKFVKKTKQRIEKDRNLLINNIDKYTAGEIEQLNIFFNDIDTIFDYNFKKLGEELTIVQLFKLSERLKQIKEINNALELFENNLYTKNKNNIKK